ncbi:hypothetical protein D3C80_43240 [compost metagenome]
MAVAIFFAADFAGGHFFNQARSAAHHFRRRERQLADALLQLQHVAVQTVGVALHALGAVVAKQGFFQTVEAGEFRIFRLLLVVVFTGINAAVKIGEQLGDRFDALVVLTRRGIQRFRFFDIARFHRVGEGLRAANQLGSLCRDVGFIGGNRFAEAQQRVGFRRVLGGRTGDNQLPFRVSQQAAGHIVFARLQVSRQLLRKARRNVFALFHDHHAFKDLPLQRLLTVVLNDELRFTRFHGHVHRFTLLVINGHFYLRNIRSLDAKGGAEQRCDGKLQRITAKMSHYDHPFR